MEEVDISHWLAAINGAISHKELFFLLDRFRTFTAWTDKERATISHAYHSRLSQLKKEESPAPIEQQRLADKIRRDWDKWCLDGVCP